jgi:hypothetical protein
VNVRFELYGKEFAILNDAKPDSVMLAEGSEVLVRMFDKIRSDRKAENKKTASKN